MKPRTTVALLVALAMLAGATLAGAVGSHSHESAEVGLYNQECSLALLAASAPSALVVHALSAARLVLLVLAIAPLVVASRPGASLRLADVRAPPVR